MFHNYWTELKKQFFGKFQKIIFIGNKFLIPWDVSLYPGPIRTGHVKWTTFSNISDCGKRLNLTSIVIN